MVDDAATFILRKIEEMYSEYPKRGSSLPYRAYIHDFSLSTENEEKVFRITAILNDLWKSHGDELTAGLFKRWSEFQNTLFMSNPRYRDHYIHAFYVFLVGYYVMNRFMVLAPTGMRFRACDLVERRPQHIMQANFMWLLSSTFHDVGYPIQMIDEIEKSFKDFLSTFGIEDVSLGRRAYELNIPSYELYIGQLASLYNNLKLRSMKDGVPNWDVSSQDRDWYMYALLHKKLRKRDHGVVSAMVLMNSIFDEMQFKLDSSEFKNYVVNTYPYVCRAALAMALHNIEPKDKLTINFNDDLISFLLLYCDQIQEWERSPVTKATLSDLLVELRGDKIAVNTVLEINGDKANDRAGRIAERLQSVLVGAEQTDFTTKIVTNGQHFKTFKIPYI